MGTEAEDGTGMQWPKVLKVEEELRDELKGRGE
jgi:hypothetical protein